MLENGKENPQVLSDSSWERRSQLISPQALVYNLDVNSIYERDERIVYKIEGQESSQLSFRMNFEIMIGYIDDSTKKGVSNSSQKMTTGS